MVPGQPHRGTPPGRRRHRRQGQHRGTVGADPVHRCAAQRRTGAAVGRGQPAAHLGVEVARTGERAPRRPHATDSPATATASSTAPSTSSPASGCPTTQPHAPTSNDARRRVAHNERSAAASSATSPASSTASSKPSLLDFRHRSVNRRRQVTVCSGAVQRRSDCPRDVEELPAPLGDVTLGPVPPDLRQQLSGLCIGSVTSNSCAIWSRAVNAASMSASDKAFTTPRRGAGHVGRRPRLV